MNIREIICLDDEIIHLYRAVGWTAYTDDLNTLRHGYENSLLVLGAYEDHELLGVIRVVGDGFTVVFIQDLLVLPSYQRLGIGSALLDEVLKRFKQVRQIQLTTDYQPESLGFYRSKGFRELSEMGCCGFIR